MINIKDNEGAIRLLGALTTEEQSNRITTFINNNQFNKARFVVAGIRENSQPKNIDEIKRMSVLNKIEDYCIDKIEG